MKNYSWVIGLFFVIQGLYSQDTIIMPVTGNGGFYNSCYAVIMDNGADSGYADYSNSRISIFTLWTQSVSVYFEEFNTEQFFDSLSIYDGPGITYPKIGTYSGNVLQGQTITSTGSSITLQFNSDDIENGSGFKAWVSCLADNEYYEIQNDFQIYPNPSYDKVWINLVENIGSITIFDLHGKQYALKLTGNELDISSLSPGVYVMSIERKDGSVISKKILKAG